MLRIIDSGVWNASDGFSRGERADGSCGCLSIRGGLPTGTSSSSWTFEYRVPKMRSISWTVTRFELAKAWMYGLRISIPAWLAIRPVRPWETWIPRRLAILFRLDKVSCERISYVVTKRSPPAHDSHPSKNRRPRISEPGMIEDIESTRSRGESTSPKTLRP